jgi:hypothetical protein
MSFSTPTAIIFCKELTAHSAFQVDKFGLVYFEILSQSVQEFIVVLFFGTQLRLALQIWEALRIRVSLVE